MTHTKTVDWSLFGENALFIYRSDKLLTTACSHVAFGYGKFASEPASLGRASTGVFLGVEPAPLYFFTTITGKLVSSHGVYGVHMLLESSPIRIFLRSGQNLISWEAA